MPIINESNKAVIPLINGNDKILYFLVNGTVFFTLTFILPFDVLIAVAIPFEPRIITPSITACPPTSHFLISSHFHYLLFLYLK